MTSSTRTYKLNGLRLDWPGRWRVLWETGSPGMPAPRLTETPIPGLDGAVVAAGGLEAIEKPMVIMVWDMDERGRRGGYRQRRTNEAILKRLLSSTRLRPGILTLVEEYTRRARTQWETPCLLGSSVEVEETAPDSAKLTFSLKLPSPVWRETVSRYCECVPDTGGTAVLLNGFTGGSAPIWPVWVVKAPVSRLIVTDVVSGELTEWQGSISGGRVLLMDTASYRWGTASLGEEWPLVEESPEWGAALAGSAASVLAAAPVWPDATGRYRVRIRVDGQDLSRETVRVMCRGKRSVL
ncbi:hypothetical protein HHJ78_10830 [Mobiluncus mulieris]|uniref:Uncharacterized protein n=1 Tax=Mobiluncus mulieris TaxID=2052 RepID=A0A7Y0U317_9ACTO|nr:hypothetical protein [Mobiluncus mulieris]NMW65978.1 hypothetical protein [Mobiluncus mulieris]